ncbi:MAG: hypothetical protein NT136_01260 [Candidatus Moranbacteria bacterium]|nr:hypothetical protein [Candidatus Moranbacteria bacterium]
MLGIPFVYIIPAYLLLGLISVGFYARWAFPVAHVFASWKESGKPERYVDRLRESQKKEFSESDFKSSKWVFFLVYPLAYAFFAILFVIGIIIQMAWRMLNFWFNGFRC